MKKNTIDKEITLDNKVDKLGAILTELVAMYATIRTELVANEAAFKDIAERLDKLENKGKIIC